MKRKFVQGVRDCRAGIEHINPDIDYTEGYEAQYHLEALQENGYCLEVDLLKVDRNDEVKNENK